MLVLFHVKLLGWNKLELGSTCCNEYNGNKYCSLEATSTSHVNLVSTTKHVHTTPRTSPNKISQDEVESPLRLHSTFSHATFTAHMASSVSKPTCDVSGNASQDVQVPRLHVHDLFTIPKLVSTLVEISIPTKGPDAKSSMSLQHGEMFFFGEAATYLNLGDCWRECNAQFLSFVNL